jgi:ATP-binding cassette subfamily F protein 3
VLLEALEDFGGTLIFVSHDRYFVDKLANKIIAVGHGTIETYPGTYEQYLWSRTERDRSTGDTTGGDASRPRPDPTAPAGTPRAGRQGNGQPSAAVGPATAAPPRKSTSTATPVGQTAAQRKQSEADLRRHRREQQARERRVGELETLIAEREQSIKDLEAAMAADGFYSDRSHAESVISRHQSLMWEVGDLMHQWESLQSLDGPKSTE